MKKLLSFAAGLLVVAGTMSLAQAESEKTKVLEDKDFVAEAASGGMLEVRLGQFAAEHAANPDVRRFGREMVQDHTKANEELKKVANDKKIEVPSTLSKKHHEVFEKLTHLRGEEFDRAYMRDMVADHHEDIALFQHEVDNGKSHEIKELAKKTIPALKHHLEMAENIHKQIGDDAQTAGNREKAR